MGKKEEKTDWCGSALESSIVGDGYINIDSDAGFMNYIKQKRKKISARCFGRKVKDPFSDTNLSVGQVYAFSNEDLDGSIGTLDMADRSVLTVGSSGDQVLISILNGAKDVTLVDANPMAKYYTALKIAAIKNLNFDHFQLYFSFDKILDSKLYSRVSHDLDAESKLFWDSIILEKTHDEATNQEIAYNIFHDMSFCADEVFQYRKDPKEYYRLRDLLNKVPVYYEVRDFGDFYKAGNGKKYDAVILSNVFNYVNINRFVTGIKNIIDNNLSDDGYIQVFNELQPYFREHTMFLYVMLNKRIKEGLFLPYRSGSGYMNTHLIYCKNNDKSPFKETGRTSEIMIGL